MDLSIIDHEVKADFALKSLMDISNNDVLLLNKHLINELIFFQLKPKGMRFTNTNKTIKNK